MVLYKMYINKKRLRQVLRKMRFERRKIKLFNDETIRKRFEEVSELDDIRVSNLWGRFNDRV